MFTGIIEDLGVVDGVAGGSGATRIVIRSGLGEGLTPGQSVAVNGVCLTVVEPGPGRFACDVLDETIARSNLKGIPAGEIVNLERALRVDGRIDGHIVQGHVDGTGRVLAVGRAGRDWEVEVHAPPDVARYLVMKGSIAVDGISLTVAGMEGNRFTVRVIPHTWEHTNLSRRRAGDRVNLETDILAKYVERLAGGRGGPGLTWDTLRQAGYLTSEPGAES